MSDITDWEPEMKPDTNWQEQYARQLKINEILIAENHSIAKQSIDLGNTLRRLQSDYAAYKKSSEQEHRCLKAEIITSLRAINLCLIASLNTEKQQLTHRARNFRMRHVNQIISNEIDRFCDRKLTSYEDDF
jgi:hypothetical protein